MPQIKPIELVTSTGTITFNPSGKVGERVNYISDEDVSLVEKQNFSIRVRPSTTANTGHLTEIQLAMPLNVDLPEGCCPTSLPNQLPVNSFNLRVLRSKQSSNDAIVQIIEELKALLNDPDIESIFKGSGLY